MSVNRNLRDFQKGIQAVGRGLSLLLQPGLRRFTLVPLALNTLLFGALISSFLLYRTNISDGTEFTAPSDVFDIPFTSLSSFVLLMSSLTMVLSLSAVNRDDERAARIWMLATAFLGMVFIGGQVFEFTEFNQKGLGYTTNTWTSAFYTLTGFHGVHVTIGIIMLMSLFIGSFTGRISQESAEKVEIIGLYWHFVDVVWLVILTVVYLFPQ